MREPSTLDLAAITLELGFLKGFYIEKFYELPNLQFRLKLNKSGEGQYNLMIVPGRLLSIASVIVQQDQPTNFSQAVRKRIANSHISDISLFNDDRVLCITVEKGDQHQYIMVEMFGRGNLIITDSDLNIELAYMRHEFSDRKIFNGEKYVAPRNKRITISRLSEEKDVEEAIQAVKNLKGKSVMQALSSVINIGSLYLEDAVIRAGIDPSALPETLTDEGIKLIAKNISAYSSVIKAPKPRLYLENGVIVDYAVCEIKKYDSMETEAFVHTYEALEKYYLSQPTQEAPTESSKAKELESSIKKQREIVEQTADEVDRLKSKGKLIYENMQLINNIINTAKSLKRFSKEDIEKEFGISVIDVDLKDKTITLDL
jgi:predicted ribosome quality control (RQC) complex YloA/Tae2 family protein